MNLLDSAFLCLDLGTSGVRGTAYHIRSGRITDSAIHTVDSTDTVSALKSVIDELEHKIGEHFDGAYITGNLGPSIFEKQQKNTTWPGEHKITASDVSAQIASISCPDGYFPMHMFPLRYKTPSAPDLNSPVGYIDTQLSSLFGVIFYSKDALENIISILHQAHIQPLAIYDSQFLQQSVLRPEKTTALFIDLGAQFTTISIWTDRGPMFHKKLEIGGTNITNEIANKFGLEFADAQRIKHNVATMLPKDMDRFTPADTEYDFSRADINDVILPIMVEICSQIRIHCGPEIQRRRPTQIILSGGGSEIDTISEFIENEFGLPVKNIARDGTLQSLFKYIWSRENAHINAYLARSQRIHNITSRITSLFTGKRRRNNTAKFIPILPSTLCFDMSRPETYSMFASGGISMIHVDIMDGLYVENIRGSIEELQYIRKHTTAHLHVHLMTESPEFWAADAIRAGANTIIISTNTSGVRSAIKLIHASGRRAGIALNPDSSIKILEPILREIDEIMIMAVAPGSAGQEFQESCLRKISILNTARKRGGFKYLISVDGGINAQTAQKCWAAGADLLVSGSYLANSADFPLAVQSLLKKSKTV